MIDTRFDTSIDLRGEIENYRQVALIKYYKMLLEIDPKKDRLTLLAVLRCIDKLERHSQERKRPRNDKKKMLAEGTLPWHYQKRNQLFRKAGLYDIESTQYLVDHYSLNIFSEIPFYRLSLYIRYLHMFSFGLNTHEISRF